MQHLNCLHLVMQGCELLTYYAYLVTRKVMSASSEFEIFSFCLVIHPLTSLQRS